MGDIISNMRIMVPLFAVAWGIFLCGFLRKPQNIRNSFYFMGALFFTAVLLTGFFGKNTGQAMLVLFLLCVGAIFCVPAMLTVNGVHLLKKEGVSLPHMLSLLLGILVGAGEIALAAGVVMGSLDSTLTKFEMVLGLVFATVFYFSLFVLSFVLYVLFLQWVPHRKNYDYVIIHGAGLVGGDRVSKLLSNRLDKAMEVYRKSAQKPVLIPSGGQGQDETVSEARAMADYLAEKGIPAEHILLEDGSATTRENLIFSAKLIEQTGGGKRVALVSSNYHIYRCTVLAAKLHLKCTGIGAEVAWYYWPSAVIREFVAIYSRKRNLFWLLGGYALIVLIPGLTLLFGT